MVIGNKKTRKMKKQLSILLIFLSLSFIFSQSKKKNATSTTISCHYCGKKIQKVNSYVVPLGSPEGRLYKNQISDIALVRKTYPNYPKENLQILESGIKKGTYFCSKKCLYSEGYRVLE